MLYQIYVFSGTCPYGQTSEWIMSNKAIVPGSLITVNDPEGEEHETSILGKSTENLEFYRVEDGRTPSVIVDIDQPGVPDSYANVFAVKIYNVNLETVSIFKKATDNDSTWTLVYNGTIPKDGEITLENGQQMGMIKIQVETGSALVENEWFIFNFDVAVCSYGAGKSISNHERHLPDNITILMKGNNIIQNSNFT